MALEYTYEQEVRPSSRFMLALLTIMLQAFAALAVSPKLWTMRTGNGTGSSQADTPVVQVRWQSYIISQQGMFHHNHQIHQLTGAESFARVSAP